MFEIGKKPEKSALFFIVINNIAANRDWLMDVSKPTQIFGA
jgi:hypothetical protein